jgi:hypothetical protein
VRNSAEVRGALLCGFVAIGERCWLKKTNQLPAKQEQEARSILMLAYCDTNVLIIFLNNNAPDCGFYP